MLVGISGAAAIIASGFALAPAAGKDIALALAAAGGG